MNMPFDIFDPREGEQILAQSELFRNNGLRLLCGAVCADLSVPDGGCPWPDVMARDRLDYLVCQGDAVLLVIDITDRDSWRGRHAQMEGVLTIQTQKDCFAMGDVDEILRMVEVIMERDQQPEWRCRLQPCPPELTGELFRQSMLERRRDGVSPTEYGSLSGGLIRVLQGGRSQAMCTAQTAKRLPELLAAGRAPAPARPDGIPFQQLLTDYRAGVSSDRQSSGELVRRVGEMPLEDWMRGLPDRLRQLRKALPRACDTYESAALAVRDMLHSGDEDCFDQGVSVMRLLASTLLEDRNMMNAMKLGRRVMGRGPDNMPPRYQTRSIRPAQSFQERVSGVRKWLPDNARLAMGTQERFFQGVSVLIRSEYPNWLAGIFRAYLELPVRCTYVDLLYIAEDSLGKNDDWLWDVGVHMLYLLLIEPYCLIASEKNG